MRRTTFGMRGGRRQRSDLPSVNQPGRSGVLVGVLRLRVVSVALITATGCATATSSQLGATSATVSQRSASATRSAASAVPVAGPSRTSAGPAHSTAATSPRPAVPSERPSPQVASTVPTHVIKTQPWTGKLGTVGARVDFGVTVPTKVRSARPCSVADLQFVPGVGVGAGSAYASISVRNRSDTVCSLDGAPLLSLLDDKGVIWNSTGSAVDTSQPATTIVVVPNSWARVAPLYLGSSCGGYGRTTELRLMLPSHGGTTSITWTVGTAGPDRCVDDGPQKPPAPHPASLPRIPFTPVGPLVSADTLGQRDRRIDLHLPVSFRRGDLLRYTVVISARSAHGAPLWDPYCPLFRQTVDHRTGPTYELNCPAAPFLRQGEAVAFQMQLRVPADTPLGRTTLTWQLIEPQQDPITATVTITA